MTENQTSQLSVSRGGLAAGYEQPIAFIKPKFDQTIITSEAPYPRADLINAWIVSLTELSNV